MNNQKELRDYVIKHGSYSPDQNLQIYEKYFTRAPRYLFRALDKKYNISKKIISDVGCSYGMNLLFCKHGSYGIEIDKDKSSFANSIGLNVYTRDIVHDDISDLPEVESIWCSAVLEHVDSPYLFLRKLYQLIKPEGFLFLYVPTIPVFPFLKKVPYLGKYVTGYEERGHINAFVPSTLRFFCESTGFRTIEISPFYPGLLCVFNHIPFFNRLTSRCVYIGKKI